MSGQSIVSFFSTIMSWPPALCPLHHFVGPKMDIGFGDVFMPPELQPRQPRPLRRRAKTLGAFELPKRLRWRDRVLRPRLPVRQVFGERPDLPELELGPRAHEAKWARLNRARPWWARMVHPNSFERRLWDAITSIFVLLSVAQVPLQMMISWWPHLHLSAHTLAALNGLMRAWFAAELVLNLRTGCVTPNGTLIMDARTSLMRRLLSGWLLVDLLGVLPHDATWWTAEEPVARYAGGLVGWGQRISDGAARVARFAGRLARGRLGRTQVQDAWEMSALAYRCKRGTADTALSYCEWHESALEQWLSIWRLCHQFHVPSILQYAHAIGWFWQTFHLLAFLGCWADRLLKLVYLTKWAKLRRLLHLAQLWRIGRKWLAVRRARTREALLCVQDSLVRSLSRTAGLDALEAEGLRSSLSRGELGSIYRVISSHASRHAGLDALALRELGARVASVPSRLSEMIPPSPIAERLFNELRAHQLRRACAREAAWLESHGDSIAEPARMYAFRAAHGDANDAPADLLPAPAASLPAAQPARASWADGPDDASGGGATSSSHTPVHSTPGAEGGDGSAPSPRRPVHGLRLRPHLLAPGLSRATKLLAPARTPAAPARTRGAREPGGVDGVWGWRVGPSPQSPRPVSVEVTA